MVKSAQDKAGQDIGFISEVDNIGLPKIAETYNRLGCKSSADILGFIHDDVTFLTEKWAIEISKVFDKNGADIIGVVGNNKISGNTLFDSGREHSYGAVACELPGIDGVTYVKVLSRGGEFEKVAAVDGLLMFVRRTFFEENKFDETFDELYYYDMDFCLRSKNVGVTDVLLVKHFKSKEFYSQYPENMKGYIEYKDTFYSKHGIKYEGLGDLRCAVVKIDYYNKKARNIAFDNGLAEYNK